MPKVVDHEDRRHELAEAAWRAIVKYGLDGTTTRLIAKESGYSAGVLAHYFESKDEILLEALRISHAGLDRRVRQVVEGKEGLEALRAFCIEILPVAEQQVRETHLEMSIWSRALVNEELRSVQRAESSRWRRLLEGLIVDAQRTGELVSTNPRTVAVMLAAFTDGLSIYALLYPDRFRKTQLIDLVDSYLEMLGPAESRVDGKIDGKKRGDSARSSGSARSSRRSGSSGTRSPK